MKEIRFQTQYDTFANPTITCETESRTKQSFKDECDINNILSKYQKTGIVNHINQSEGQYGDFTSEQDYQKALNTVIQAQDMFSSRYPYHLLHFNLLVIPNHWAGRMGRVYNKLIGKQFFEERGPDVWK